MFKILHKQSLSPQVDEMIVNAPYIARHTKAGNFAVLRVHEKGERIPLTIADSDAEKGTITLLFQKIGKITEEMGTLKPGENIKDIAVPLGHPTPIKKYGHCVLVGGGIGTATLYPILKALKANAHEVDFQELASRLNFYKQEKEISLKQFRRKSRKKCRGKCNKSGSKR